jgi:uncharacterized protein YajQ (UPF0234 family)
MKEVNISEIDNLFKAYNYQVASMSNSDVRIYTLRYGMYDAAEILVLNPHYDFTKVKSEYSELGYATEVQSLLNLNNIEEYLFEGFFIKTPLGNELKNRYKQFEKKQITNLPEKSTYKYIHSSYEYSLQDESGALIEHVNYNGDTDKTLIEKINEILVSTDNALFIIIEAAAGFGKTCTANEILNTFSTEDSKKLPFFTELSRNREARVFKHILLNEIDEQFPTGIKQNIVIDQIVKGRIPLIIDGFDELITKDSNKEEVESMLTTIMELLKGQAKIIITSRKTAIFNSEEFIESVFKNENSFSIARFEIKEPTIENWLEKDRIQLISDSNFQLSQIANPVLLSYLRNIDIETLKSYLSLDSSGTLIDKYIDYLLTREITRQNLKLNKESQLRIFRKLLRIMTEFGVTTESKNIIKDLIKDYNFNLLRENLKEYPPDERPSLDDLVETLSNHVFLDRKPGNNIGFINDFIFGLLIGENLILGKFKEHYGDNFSEIIPVDFAIKSLQSFKIQSKSNRELLWAVYNDKTNGFEYDVKFYFDLDYSFLNEFRHTYEGLFISNEIFKEARFHGDAKFRNSIFTNVRFESCLFDLDIFEKTSFTNCNFYNCTISCSKGCLSFQDFAAYGCEANNTFLNQLESLANSEFSKHQSENSELTEILVLSQFFGIANKKTKAKKFTSLRASLNEFPLKEISKVISQLKTNDYIYMRDDIGIITKKGINFFNQNKSSL